MEGSSPYLLVDVRPEVEVEMCAIQDSINLPLARLKEGREEDVDLLQSKGKGRPIYMICRFKEFNCTKHNYLVWCPGEVMTARRG